MKIMFDFDHTVFDMSAMHQAMEEAVTDLGIASAVYRDAYSRETDWKMFALPSFAQRLSKQARVHEAKVLQTLEEVASRAHQWVYEDVIEGLAILRGTGHEVSLLTWGDTDWQNKKIQASGLTAYCRQVIPVSEGKADALKSWVIADGPAVLIDDKPAELRAVADFGLPIRLIRMRRAGAKYSDHDTPAGMVEATNMPDVIKIIGEWNKS